MKYFVLLLLVALVYCDEDFVPRTREDAAAAVQRCLTKMGMSEVTFNEMVQGLNGNEDLVRSMTKCTAMDLGFLEEGEDGTGVFNKDRLVKQHGGEASRATVEKCVDDNPIGMPTLDKSVYAVMHCMEVNELRMFQE